MNCVRRRDVWWQLAFSRLDASSLPVRLNVCRVHVCEGDCGEIAVLWAGLEAWSAFGCIAQLV